MHTGWAFQWSTARPVHAHGAAPAGRSDRVGCRWRVGFSGRNPFCQTRLGAGERRQHPSAPDLAPRGPYARAGVVAFKLAELCVRHAQGSRAGSGAGHEDLYIPGPSQAGHMYKNQGSAFIAHARNLDTRHLDFGFGMWI